MSKNLEKIKKSFDILENCGIILMRIDEKFMFNTKKTPVSAGVFSYNSYFLRKCFSIYLIIKYTIKSEKTLIRTALMISCTFNYLLSALT